MVCHTCDNPPCCRGSHLFLGDALANMQDKVAKGRAINKSLDANLPPLTHLQFLVLAILRDAWPEHVEARILLRGFMEAGAANRSLPAFYQFMKRLRAERFITKRSKGSATYYRINRAGLRAMEENRRFYTP